MRPLPLTCMLVGLVVAGCATTAEVGRPFKASLRSRLRVDWTTRNEATQLLGPPLATSGAGTDHEVWVYEHSKISGSPRLSPFHRDVKVAEAPHEVLTLDFDYGVLSKCAYFVEEFRAEGTRTVPVKTAKEDCAAPARAGG